jgi:acyl-CoA thioester hydrolase
MDHVKRATHHTTAKPDDLTCKPSGLPRASFKWNVRVYYEDTDLGGVVYHANYLRFLERARTEWLRSLGFEQDTLRDRLKVQFVVVEAKIGFRRPARFNDELLVSVEVREIGRASIVFDQDIHAAAARHAEICRAEIRVACIDSGNFKPKSLPPELLTELAA